MKEEKRIYVVIPATVEVPDGSTRKGVRHVLQPHGRQIAQACHVVSKLRHQHASYWIPSEKPYKRELVPFEPLTTIILQARDSKEMIHNFLALQRKQFEPVIFSDENEEAYGNFRPVTAMAVLAAPSRIESILGYLPLWGS